MDSVDTTVTSGRALRSRLLDWEFSEAKNRLNGQSDYVKRMVTALADCFGDHSRINGPLHSVVHAAVARLVSEDSAAVEQLRVQLASCSVAANGGTKYASKEGDYGWSPAYQKVLELRQKYEKECEHTEKNEKVVDDVVAAGRCPVDRKRLLEQVYLAANRALCYVVGNTPTPFIDVDQVLAKLEPAVQEALVGLIIPYEKENPAEYTEKLGEFAVWREGIDSEHICDEYDLALGWFAGKGFSHEQACEAAAFIKDGEGSDLDKDQPEEPKAPPWRSFNAAKDQHEATDIILDQLRDLMMQPGAMTTVSTHTPLVPGRDAYTGEKIIEVMVKGKKT